MEASEVFKEIQPFTGLPEVRQEALTVLGDATAQREIAEVQAAMAIAKRFPRNQMKALDRILTACQRPTLAEVALYSYARGGTEISGAGIRLAETIVQQWGNIDFGIRELDQRIGESTVQAYAWDLETNTRQTKTFQVKHRRHTKKGGYNLEDPRDIYEMVANQGARRVRACILGIIPGDVVEAAVAQCEQTLKAKADISPDAVKKMVEVFAGFGVNQQQIEARIQRKIESITPAQIISLRKVFNSLKDGMSKPQDWFEEVSEPDINCDKKKPGRKPKPTSPDPAGETITPPASESITPQPRSAATETSVGPRGITEPQLEELRKVPADLLADAWMECNLEPMDLVELDEQTAAAILEWVRRQ
jgi:hypothetical protein